MTPRLHLVMTCSRFQNIAALADAYLCKMEPSKWELRWHIMVQGPEPDPKGVSKTNEALNAITDGWVFMVADDTIQHPALFRRMWEIIEAHPYAMAVVFIEQRPEGILKASPDTVDIGQICGGMVAFRRDAIADLRFDYAKFGQEADGHFIKDIYARHGKSFVFVNETLTTFNSIAA